MRRSIYKNNRAVTGVLMLLLFGGCRSVDPVEPVEQEGMIEQEVAKSAVVLKEEPPLFPSQFLFPECEMSFQSVIPLRQPMISIEAWGKGPPSYYLDRYQQLIATNGWSLIQVTNQPSFFLLHASSNQVSAEIRGVAGERSTALFLLFDGIELPKSEALLEVLKNEELLRGKRRRRN
jgi:hypothetical protein